MNWIKLDNIEQLEQIKKESANSPFVIFKHSTTCSISATALDRFERAWARTEEHKNVKPYLLDLLNFRPISNAIATEFGVQHESPQLLMIKDGEVKLHDSHYSINLNKVLENA
jgi:bacillithiol system protein YtxJ